MSPALAGRFSTTVPPGKPRFLVLMNQVYEYTFFSFIDSAFGVMSKNSSPNPITKTFFYVFFEKFYNFLCSAYLCDPFCVELCIKGEV